MDPSEKIDPTVSSRSQAMIQKANCLTAMLWTEVALSSTPLTMGCATSVTSYLSTCPLNCKDMTSRTIFVVTGKFRSMISLVCDLASFTSSRTNECDSPSSEWLLQRKAKDG